jgi:hypothetical protein
VAVWVLWRLKKGVKFARLAAIPSVEAR